MGQRELRRDLSAVFPDIRDKDGNLCLENITAKTRMERHQQLMDQAVEGCVSQAQIAHEISGGNGLINMNVLWELADSQYLIKNVLERAKGLINGVVSGAGLPIKLAELTSQFKVFYYPIVSSGRALQILIKRGYDKYKEYMGGVIYEDPWFAGGHCGFSNTDEVGKPQSPYAKVVELRKVLNANGLDNVPIIIAGGVWSLVNRLGQILLDGLDLLITNLFINSTMMGVLSLSKTIPSTINGIVSTLVNIFSPNFTILYAQGKKDELLKSVKQSMKIMGVITNLPVIVLLLCGKDFYALWQPTVDTNSLYILSVMGCGCIIFSGGINCIYNIFTVVNKLRANSIVVIVSGLLSTLVVYILVNTTSLGVYAVAGVSTAFSILRNLLFTAPYGAKCLGIKWYSFYPDIIRPVIYVAVTYAIGYFTINNFAAQGWIALVVKAAVTAVMAVFIGYFAILGKDERAIVKNIVKTKILKKRS